MNLRKNLIRLACWAALPAAVAAAGPSSRPAAADGAKPAETWTFTETPEQIAERLDKAGPSDRQKDPLKYVASDMSSAVGELSAYRTDKPVQETQARVVGTLDVVIKELEKQCKGGAAGSGGGKPLGRSVLAKGPGGQGEMIDPKRGDKQWASLQPKQREQILQSQTEGFPPGYETILQSYYRRLSQEQVTPDGAAPAAAPAADAPPASPAAPAAGSPRVAPAPATQPVAP